MEKKGSKASCALRATLLDWTWADFGTVAGVSPETIRFQPAAATMRKTALTFKKGVGFFNYYGGHHYYGGYHVAGVFLHQARNDNDPAAEQQADEYRRRAKVAHPDNGDSAEHMAKLNAAVVEASQSQAA